MDEKERDTLRKKIYIIIFRSDTKPGKLFDIIILILILISILSVSLESVAEIKAQYFWLIKIMEWVITISFTIEYALRIYSTRNRWHYIFSFYGIIDLIAIVPNYLSIFIRGGQYLTVVRGLRLLRVFRILQLSNFSKEGNVLLSAIRSSMYKITVFLMGVLTLVIIVGTLMYLIEGSEAGFTSIPVSIYWSIVTVTTVGYGDISPITPLGRLLASMLMITGYGIIAVPTGIMSAEIARANEAGKQRCPSCHKTLSSENANFCQHCGTKLSPNVPQNN